MSAHTATRAALVANQSGPFVPKHCAGGVVGFGRPRRSSGPPRRDVVNAICRPSRGALDNQATVAPYSSTHTATRPEQRVQDPAIHDSPRYHDSPLLAIEQYFQAQCSHLLEALAASGAPVSPSTATQLLWVLHVEQPPASSATDGRLVAVNPGLLPLLERAIECCDQAVQAARPDQAAATGRAALCLLSCLRFSSSETAAPYEAVAVRCKRALKAAYDGGAAFIEEDVIELHTACAHASLWLTPYFGYRFACGVDEFVTAGWSTGELAVQYTEAWSTLTGQGRFSQLLDKFVRLVRAAMQHPLSLDQLRRLLACTTRLPVDMSIALELHARSQPADCWYRDLTQRLQLEEQRSAASRTAPPTATTKPRGGSTSVAVPAVA